MEIGEYYLHNYHEEKWNSRDSGDIWVLVDTNGPHTSLKVVSPLETYCAKSFSKHTASLEKYCLEKI